MSQKNDQWTWYVDESLVEALLKDDGPAGMTARRPSPEAVGRALSMHADGRSEEAIAELQASVERGQDVAEALSAMGHIFFGQRKFEEAAARYAKAGESDPKHRTAHFNAAVSLERMRRFPEALAAFERACQVDPQRANANLGRGICLLHLKNYPKALAAFDACLQKEPNSAGALFGRAVSLHFLRKLDEALECYRKLLSGTPGEELLCNILCLSAARSDAALMREAAEKLLALRPQSRQALEGLANAGFLAGDHEAAARWCGKLVEAVPDQTDAWFNLGVACQRLGRLQQSAQAYSQCIRLKPGFKEAALNLGSVLEQQDDFQGARKAYELALKAAPEDASIMCRIAAGAERSGDREAAKSGYRKALNRDRTNANAAFRLGLLHFDDGQVREAAEGFEACLRLRPGWTDARVNLGLALQRLGDPRTSEVLGQALKEQPKCVEAMAALALAAVEKNDRETANGLRERLAAENQDVAQLTYNIALLYQEAGDAAVAEKLYRAALAGAPRFSEALLNLGHALKAQGREEEARTCWRQAVGERPDLAQGYFDRSHSV